MTPIVVTQLHNTKKHKDELRKARRGSQPKASDVTSAGVVSCQLFCCHLMIVFLFLGAGAKNDVVSDSGAESCSEDSRRRTAEAFMTGIISSIPSQEQSEDKAGSQEDIVSEVRSP